MFRVASRHAVFELGGCAVEGFKPSEGSCLGNRAFAMQYPSLDLNTTRTVRFEKPGTDPTRYTQAGHTEARTA